MSKYGVRLVLKNGDFVKNSNGQLMTTRDYEAANKHLAKFEGYFNVLFALSDRLFTPKGDNVFNPDYGSNLHLLIGKNNSPATREAIREEVKNSLQEDPLVDTVKVTVVEQRDNILTIQADIVLNGHREATRFVFPEIFIY